MPINRVVYNLCSYPDYIGLSDADAATLANTKSIRRTDSTLKNGRAVIHVVGVMKAQQLYNALATLIQGLLDADGIDFSSTQNQSMIDQLVASNAFSADDGKALKEIGVWQVSPYNDMGGIGQCTAQDFADARKEIALLAHAVDRYNTAIDAIANGNVADLAALKAILGA